MGAGDIRCKVLLITPTHIHTVQNKHVTSARPQQVVAENNRGERGIRDEVFGRRHLGGGI
jgi:hypothetical protein